MLQPVSQNGGKSQQNQILAVTGLSKVREKLTKPNFSSNWTLKFEEIFQLLAYIQHINTVILDIVQYDRSA